MNPPPIAVSQMQMQNTETRRCSFMKENWGGLPGSVFWAGHPVCVLPMRSSRRAIVCGAGRLRDGERGDAGDVLAAERDKAASGPIGGLDAVIAEQPGVRRRSVRGPSNRVRCRILLMLAA